MSATVVGVGPAGPSPEGARAIAGAELLIGGARLLERFADHPGEKWDLTGRLKEIVPLLRRSEGRAVVILASGDPLLFGIGGYLSKKIEGLRFLPATSSVAEAFARIGLRWDDAALISVHGRPIGDLAGALARSGKLAVLTSAENSPAAIGARLGDIEGTAHVCEALGTERERVRSLPIAELAGLADVDPLNVLILEAPRRPRPVIPHTPDEDFEKKMPRKGLITKREVRSLSLATLGLRPGDVCWDIGAGSGAVGIDMYRLGASEVWAFEKNADGCAIIRQNVAAFGAAGVRVVHARAPEGLAEAPDPDRVFIGGSGGALAALVAIALDRLRPGGALLVNAITVETLSGATAAIRASGFEPEVTLLQISRGKTILGRMTRFAALNPVYLIAARKGGA